VTHRVPVVVTDAVFGSAIYALGPTGAGSSAQAITPGSTWNFRSWYRDAIGGAATCNTTNGFSAALGNRSQLGREVHSHTRYIPRVTC
jgi:hypothetical protein